MKKYYSYLAIILFSFSFLNSIYAQTKKTNKIVHVVTKDGNIIKGKLIKENKDYVRIKTESAGVIKIKKNKIKNIDYDYKGKIIDNNEIVQVKQKSAGYKNYAYRYFVGSSGYNLKKGESYYANTWILYNDFNFGITDRLSLGYGTMPLFLFQGATPIWFKSKLSFPIIPNQVNISTGAILGTVLGSDGIGEGLFWLYGVSTFGSRTKNISFGINALFGENLGFPLLVTISGIYQISPRSFLIMDNYIDIEDSFIFSILGARTIFRGITLDYGGMLPLGSGSAGIYIIPYLGFKIGFGK